MIDPLTETTFKSYKTQAGGISYKRQKFTDKKTGEVFGNIEVSGVALESFVWEHIKLAIQKPKKFFKLYKKQTKLGKRLETLERKRDFYLDSIQKQQEIIDNAVIDNFSGGIDEETRKRIENKCEKNMGNLKIELDKTEKEIDQIVEAQISKDAIEDFSKNFEGKIENLTYDQKITLADILIDRVEVVKNDDVVGVKVFFKFEPPYRSRDLELFELENSLDKPKETSQQSVSLVNGGR